MKRDYGKSGMDIQAAMLDQIRRHGTKVQQQRILLWDGLNIQTSISIPIPLEGTLTATMSESKGKVKQGFDLKVNRGHVILAAGEQVSLLRTWNDVSLCPTVTYPFKSDNGSLWFWNVYERKWPDGRISEEKWTGNAGFWTEMKAPNKWVFHCSHGMNAVPDFESLIVEITIQEK